MMMLVLTLQYVHAKKVIDLQIKFSKFSAFLRRSNTHTGELSVSDPDAYCDKDQCDESLQCNQESCHRNADAFLFN